MSTSFEPISTSESIISSIERYLRTNFNPRRASIARDYSNAIDESKENREIGGALYREVRRSFTNGKSLQEYVSEGKAHPEITRFTKFPLYSHQSKTFQLAACESRNVIIATGTGSGKTESFLLPIINSLLKERDAGTLGPGIRAIIVYPMNALASDQLERMRSGLSSYPDITFGRFVGPTKQTRKEAISVIGSVSIPPNERVSRDEMIAKPPHILITNYSMLERLLLLPKWAPLFTGNLQWIVMDEVHSYDGTKAIEISMLIRRLKSRSKSINGIHCIAASATLGDPNSELDGRRAAEYASKLFGERFEPQDLVRPEYEDKSEQPDPVDLFLSSHKDLIPIYQQDPQGIYHLFVRNPGGAFICLNTSHETNNSRIRLQSAKNCASCDAKNVNSRLIEIGACRKCGTEYLIGKKVRNNELVIVDETDEQTQYFRLVSVDLNDWSEDDKSGGTDDLDSDDESSQSAIKNLWWCTSCACISEKQDCECGEKLHVVITEALRPNRDGKLQCNSCGSPNERSPFGPILRPVSGVDALTSVVTTALYQKLPKENNEGGSGGRKLLAFSDNRQDAAYFAPYLEASYFDLLRRRVIYQAAVKLRESQYFEGTSSLKDISASMKTFEFELGNLASENLWTWTWLRGELLTTDIGSTLSDTGLLKFFVPKSKLSNSIKYLKSETLDEDESWNVINALLKTVAYDGAIELPVGVDPANEIFAPREKPTYLSRVGTEMNVKPWISEATVGNRRTSIIEKTFQIERAEATRILGELWNRLNDDSILNPEKTGLRTIANQAWSVEVDDSGLFRCPICRRVSYWKLPNNLCTTKKCGGRLIPFEVDKGNHYRKIFTELDIAPLTSKEHTAQWTAEEAERVQDEFIEGKVNVLSCSTTFEMGVDIGSIVSVLCRNVPPTPANYVQRAGRAGRRGDKALIVTFARKRSHDSQYIAEPLRLIKGRIPVPSIILENQDLIRRHIYAMALSKFLREVNFTGIRSDEFFEAKEGSKSVAQEFRLWLKSHPQVLATEINSLGLPGAVLEKIGILDWSWVDLLDEVDENHRGAWLKTIETLYLDETQRIESVVEELKQQPTTGARGTGNPLARAGLLARVLGDLKKKQMIEPLANGGVLPKYGFPVDIASLVPSYSSPQQADRIELQRDLSLAISEYAPGSKVIAGGHVLTSTGIRRPNDNTFNSMQYVTYTCDGCGWFWHQLAPEGINGTGTQKNNCENCGLPFDRKDKRLFLQPQFGFIANVESRSAGINSRPRKATGINSYVSSTNESDVNWITTDKFEYSVSHNSQLLTITAKELLFCYTCGFAQPLEKGRTREHLDPRNNKTCSSTRPPSPIYLGHEFKTDVFRIRFEAPLPECECGDADCLGALDSTAAAMVAGAVRTLGVSTSDINASIGKHGLAKNRINLFDTTPGGVGLAIALGERVEEVLQNALNVAKQCPNCNSDSSCYSCLRNYYNQKKHDHLIRRNALEILTELRS